MKKISQKRDELFTVYSYIMDDGQDAIERWYENQPEEIQAAFVLALKQLRSMPRKYWRSSLFCELGKGGQTACLGLSRIKVMHKPDGPELQERILVCYGPKERQITLLMAFSKGADPDYSKSCPEAQQRAIRMTSDANRSHACRL
jgi:hypothetical protein